MEVVLHSTAVGELALFAEPRLSQRLLGVQGEQRPGKAECGWNTEEQLDKAPCLAAAKLSDVIVSAPAQQRTRSSPAALLPRSNAGMWNQSREQEEQFLCGTGQILLACEAATALSFSRAA